jgi:uncharacterized membrane protein YphA (DoxX/SURF4 family)
MRRPVSDFAQQRPGVLLLRFTVAGLMLFHGAAKLRNGLGGIESLLSGVGLPPWIAWGVLIGEVVAPLLVLAGVWVRPAALVMAFNMVLLLLLDRGRPAGRPQALLIRAAAPVQSPPTSSFRPRVCARAG